MFTNQTDPIKKECQRIAYSIWSHSPEIEHNIEWARTLDIYVITESIELLKRLHHEIKQSKRRR